MRTLTEKKQAEKDELRKVAETIRTMKEMYRDGFSVEHIAANVPCWIRHSQTGEPDLSGWSLNAVERICQEKPSAAMAFVAQIVH